MFPAVGVKRKRLEPLPPGTAVDDVGIPIRRTTQEDERRDDAREDAPAQDVSHDDDEPAHDDDPEDDDDEDALPSSVNQKTRKIATPSTLEKEQHPPHHIPFGSWCENCV